MKRDGVLLAICLFLLLALSYFTAVSQAHLRQDLNDLREDFERTGAEQIQYNEGGQ